MDFTPRIRQILLIMLNEDDVMPVQKIANQLNVSKRTIQREFEFLLTVLKKYNLSFMTKQGSGVWLEGSPEDKNTLLTKLTNYKQAQSIGKSERQERLLMELMLQKYPQKLFYYSDKLGVSESTISNDLDVVKKWLIQNNLQLIRSHGMGIYIKGTENNKRLSMRKFINESMDYEQMRDILYKREHALEITIDMDNASTIFDLLNRKILNRIISCVNKIKDKRLDIFTDQSYVSMVLHIAIAIERIIKGYIIEELPTCFDDMQVEGEHKLARKIVEALEAEFDFVLPNSEYAYIMLHIKGSKLKFAANNEQDKVVNVPKKDIMNLVTEMIDAFDNKYAYQLKCDEELINGLLLHLEPTFVRLKNGMHIYNPLLENIQTEYGNIFKKSLKAAKVMESRTGYDINEDETGYLAMHFGAAIARIKDQITYKRRVNIGIVCASGIGVARLMLMKLKNNLRNTADVFTYAKEDITPASIEQMDFFVSSISLSDLNVDYLKVSPLLLETDIDNIRYKINNYKGIQKNRHDTGFLNQLNAIHIVTILINSILRNFQLIKVNKDITFEQLLTTISKNAANTTTYQEMIYQDIEKREQLSTQVIPECGFALLHCRTNGVGCPVFYIYRPYGDINFQNIHFQDSRSVIVMLMPVDDNKGENTEIMGYLSCSLLEDEDFLQVIFEKEHNDIKKKLELLLKQYFKKYIEG